MLLEANWKQHQEEELGGAISPNHQEHHFLHRGGKALERLPEEDRFSSDFFGMLHRRESNQCREYSRDRRFQVFLPHLSGMWSRGEVFFTRSREHEPGGS